MMYTVGNKLKISLFGKSHAECIGCIMEGVPAGMKIDMDFLENQMKLRKPTDGIGTPRKEGDEVIFEYGLESGITNGSPVLMTIYNKNRNSASYSGFNITPRPGHSDLPALFKFKNYDVSGGAQFSGRMTAPLVAAGSIAKQYLKSKGIEISAYTKSIYNITDEREHSVDMIKKSTKYSTRAIDSEYHEKFFSVIEETGKEKDSVGGTIFCCVTGLPIGFGGEWFDALDVSIARTIFSIPAVKGVEFGKGFDITKMKGSESNDSYFIDNNSIKTKTNNMGGVCGGLSNGMPLTFTVAIKPTPSIGLEQKTVDIQQMKDATVIINGRHDPCIVPRAVAVVEAMTAITIMDQMLSFSPIQ